MVSIRLSHGLGDLSNAAHLLALYRKLGHEVDVECTPDKAPLLKAAGCNIVSRATTVHSWPHAPSPGPPNHRDHWAGNKTAFNLSRHPLPNIGSYEQRWAELCSIKLNLDDQVTPEVELETERYIQGLPRPLVLFAPQGNTCPERKNLPHDIQAEVLRGLLDLTEGSVMQLDWDNRVYRLNNWRVRHLTDDWHRLTTLELYQLIKRADLVIGVDSGVLHFTRFTDTPAIGCWTHHYPSSFALPRKATLNLVPASRNDLTRYRRLAYNLVEYHGGLTGRFIAEQAVHMLGQRKYLTAPAADCVLRQLVGYCRQGECGLTSFVDRHKTFDAFLNNGNRKANPLVVETGCIRAIEDYSAGYSTYLLGYFLHHHGGKLISVDLNHTNVGFARDWTTAYGPSVEIHHAHSHNWLRGYRGPPIDLLYLDSADIGTVGYQECARTEAELALPHLAPDAVILFDDTCWAKGRFQGKGATAVPWLQQRGWQVLTGGYQVLMGRAV